MGVKHAFQSAKADGADTSLVRPSNWNAEHTIDSFALPSDISPAQLTADQNDWNPTDLATASVVRFSTNALRNLTGLQGGADGRIILLANVGSFRLHLKHENASSVAANRFACPAETDFIVGENNLALLVYDSTSSRWRIVGRANPVTVALTADQSNSTTTSTEVTGLTIPLGAGIYSARYLIRYQSAATTTGVKFAVNFTGTVTWMTVQSYFNTTGGAAATAAATQVAATATGNLIEGFSRRANNTDLQPTVSVDAANSDMFMVVEALFQCSTAGNLQLKHGSEVAAASTVKAGTSLILHKTG